MMKVQGLVFKQEAFGYHPDIENELDEVRDEMFKLGRKIDSMLMFDTSSIKNTTLDLAEEAILSVALNDHAL